MNERINDHGEAKTEIRIFMDGAFDLMHYGHMNAFRLGRSLGTYLVVGVNSDKSIAECKGPPLMNDQERLAMVKSCKFVDEVIPDCPYIMNAEYVNWVIQEYKIDFVVHGDDPCIVDGKDVYAAAKEAGKFRTIPRTNGISTTDIIGRMLQFTKRRQTSPMSCGVDSESASVETESARMPAEINGKYLGQQSKFLVTSRVLHSFYGASSPTASQSNRRTVYIDGAWDLFHPGHVAILQAAKEVRVPCKSSSKCFLKPLNALYLPLFREEIFLLLEFMVTLL
jgi:ethanolamine-phosphate cytidylyltransferase